MKNEHSKLLIVLLLALAMVLAACQTAQQATEAPAEATEAPVEPPEATEEPMEATEEPMEATEEVMAAPLIVLIDNDEGPITPANANTFIGGWMTGWIYDPLYIRTPDLGTVPHLATSATPSEDGLTWSIALRENVS